MTFSSLRVTIDNRTAVLRLDRASQRNAINSQLAIEIDAALAALDSDPQVRSIILTGGTDFFSAGTDLHEKVSPATPLGGEYGLIRRRRNKPLIGAVEGFALGGGFEIVLACDLVVAAQGAMFGLPEVKLGVIASCGGLFRATSKLPHNIALHMLLTGEHISAERGYEFGLVNVLTETGSALHAAQELSDRLINVSPEATRLTLEALQTAQFANEELLWPLTTLAEEKAAQSDDQTEGIRAFFEKRSPNWAQDL